MTEEETNFESKSQLESMIQLHIHAADSLRYRVSTPHWQNWYEKMYAARDSPSMRGPRITEDNFFDFQKKCYHTILAHYIIAEVPEKIAETNNEITDMFGSVDQELMDELVPDMMEGTREYLKEFRKAFTSFIKEPEQRRRSGPTYGTY